jgi:hypothetical protein
VKARVEREKRMRDNERRERIERERMERRGGSMDDSGMNSSGIRSHGGGGVSSAHQDTHGGTHYWNEHSNGGNVDEEEVFGSGGRRLGD